VKISLTDLSQKAHVEAILSIIERECGKLPNDGIIAGQSVSSAIMEYLDTPWSGLFNDADVFYIVDGDGAKGERPFKPRAYLSRGANTYVAGMVEDAYGVQVRGVVHKQLYNIVGVGIEAYNQNVNTIFIEPNALDEDASDADVIQLIVGGFDFNAVQVGISINTRTLVFTPSFADFIATGVVDLSFVGTPVHTAVRLLKKKEGMMNVTIDEDALMLRLSTVRMCFYLLESTRDYYSQFTVGQLHTAKTEEKWARYPAMQNYFDYVDETLLLTKNGDEEAVFRKAIPKRYLSEVTRRMAFFMRFYINTRCSIDWMVQLIDHLCLLTMRAMNGEQVAMDKIAFFDGMLATIKREASGVILSMKSNPNVHSKVLNPLFTLWVNAPVLPATFSLADSVRQILHTPLLLLECRIEDMSALVRMQSYMDALDSGQLKLVKQLWMSLDMNTRVALLNSPNVEAFLEEALRLQLSLILTMKKNQAHWVFSQDELAGVAPLVTITPFHNELDFMQQSFGAFLFNLSYIDFSAFKRESMSGCFINGEVLAVLGITKSGNEQKYAYNVDCELHWIDESQKEEHGGEYYEVGEKLAKWFEKKLFDDKVSLQMYEDALPF
jgi:hypothetical protein